MNDPAAQFTSDFTLIEDYCTGNASIPITPSTDISAVYLGRRVDLKNAKLKSVSPRVIPAENLLINVRIARIIKDFIGLFVWLDQGNSALREVTLRSIQVGVQEYLEPGNSAISGMGPSGMKIISSLAKQTSCFINECCNSSKPFVERVNHEIHRQMREVILDFIRERYPHDDMFLQEVEALCTVFFDGCIAEVITPQKITEILLSIKFPYGEEEGGEEDLGEVGIYSKQYPKECDELGDSILDCVDTLMSTAQDRVKDKKVVSFFKKILVKGGTALLRAVKRRIGAYVFATIDASLKAEGSTALKIVELWLVEMGQPKENIDPKLLQQKLELTIRKDFLRLIKYAIDEREDSNKALKAQADEIINALAPVIVGMVWDETKPISQLLLHYIPKAFKKPPVPLQVISSNASSKPGSQKFESLVMQLVQDYLPEGNWKAIVICSLKTGMRKFISEMPVATAPMSSHENIMQLGFIIAAMNKFFQDAIKKNYEFKFSDEYIQGPLRVLVQQMIQLKFPDRPELQGEASDLSFGFIKILLDKLLDPVSISNFILKIKLDPSKITSSPPAGKMEFLPGYEAVGIEIVRFFRTVMVLGSHDNSLGKFKKFIAGVTRWKSEWIGSMVAQAIQGASASNENTLIDFFEGIMKSEVKQISDPEELKRALKVWQEKELNPFISAIILSQGGIIGNMLEGILLRRITIMTDKLFGLLWHPENKALRLLLIHYLLPIYAPLLNK